MESETLEEMFKEPDAIKEVLRALAPLKAAQQIRVINFVLATLQPAAPAVKAAGGVRIPIHNTQIDVDAKTFLAQKKPTNDSERIACLAYYLVHARAQAKFVNLDITTLNTDAAQRGFGNPAASIKNAIDQSGYLAAGGDGSRQITARGEAVVEALPDREAVRRAQEEHPGPRRRKGVKTDKE